MTLLACMAALASAALAISHASEKTSAQRPRGCGFSCRYAAALRVPGAGPDSAANGGAVGSAHAGAGFGAEGAAITVEQIVSRTWSREHQC